MADIKKLLRKKGWTGKELGQIELSNMCYQFDQQLHGKTPTPLVSSEEMDKMLQTISTNQKQIDAFNTYILIHRWTNVIYNIASAQEQQLQGNIKTLFNYINVSMALEQAYAYTNRLPVIMTQKQYNDFVSKREKEICNCGGGMKYNLFAMFLEALTGLVKQLQKNPSNDNPLKELKPQLEKEKVQDRLILDRYCDATDYGYWEIDETGERSDQLTDEEWEQAIIAPELPEEQRTQYGKVLSQNAACETELSRAIFNDATKEEIKSIKEKYSREKHQTYHYYDNPPDELTKWDIITLDSHDLHRLYCSSLETNMEGDSISGETLRRAVTEEVYAFKEEFPNVFNAVTEDMKQYIGDDADKPIEQWADIVYSWEEIHKMQYYGFNETFFADYSIFEGNRKAVFNGVAILQEGTFNKHQIDERGYYKATNIFDSFGVLSIDSLFSDSPLYADNSEEVEEARERMLESYYFLLGFNKAIDLVAEYFDVPALSVLKLQVKLYEKKLNGLDAVVAMLYKDITDNDYEDKELQEKKLKVLKDFFPPIECDKIQIPQECIDAAIEAFKDSSVFEGSELTNILCLRH